MQDTDNLLISYVLSPESGAGTAGEPPNGSGEPVRACFGFLSDLASENAGKNAEVAAPPLREWLAMTH